MGLTRGSTRLASLAGYLTDVDMRWPVNPRSLTAVLISGFVQAGGHMGSALDHADIRGF